MIRKILSAIAAISLLTAPELGMAQSTITAVTGYNTTVGCPTGQFTCFVQYGPSGGSGGGTVAISQATPGTTNGVQTLAGSVTSATVTNTGFNALQGGNANSLTNPFYEAPSTGSLWTVQGLGTAGAPAGGVSTVQSGIVGQTYTVSLTTANAPAVLGTNAFDTGGNPLSVTTSATGVVGFVYVAWSNSISGPWLMQGYFVAPSYNSNGASVGQVSNQTSLYPSFGRYAWIYVSGASTASATVSVVNNIPNNNNVNSSLNAGSNTIGAVRPVQYTPTTVQVTTAASASTALQANVTGNVIFEVRAETATTGVIYVCMVNQTCSASVHDEIIPVGSIGILLTEPGTNSAKTYFTTVGGQGISATSWVAN